MGGHNDALGWLTSTIEFMDGETATIRRGAASTPVTIVRGDNRPKLLSSDGQAYVELEHQEVLVRKAAYKFSGVQKDPLPGDRVIIGTEVYAAVPYVTGEGCWRNVSQYPSLIRIHVQLVND